jgi:hypothetical protein
MTGIIREILAAAGYVAFIVTWMAGAVLAPGFGLAMLAIFLPPYGWYLIVERVMRAWGLV